jgi:hypothetical protein
MTNISFFGASITQQQSGYVYHFKGFNPNYNIKQFGYGGMHITNAGICCIDEVISQQPDYCFLDWFSPECYRPPERINEYLDTIIEKLLNINCHPIFLFFYRKGIDEDWFSMFDYIKEYGNKYNINHIDLSKLQNADQYLRDTIHTNDLGSKTYGDIIYEQFCSMNFKKHTAIPQKNRWSQIHSINSKLTAKNHIVLKSSGCSSIVGVLQKVGPYTEHIDYFNKNESSTKFKLKDQWSEKYERTVIKLHIDSFCEELLIKIPEGSKLVWEKIFYIGDHISIIDYA